MATSFTVAVDQQFRAWLAAAATRLGYLYPDATFTVIEAGLNVSGGQFDEAVARREVLHAVYRERILDQYAALRLRLLEGLLA